MYTLPNIYLDGTAIEETKPVKQVEKPATEWELVPMEETNLWYHETETRQHVWIAEIETIGKLRQL